MTEQIERKQPERIKVNSSLVRRPLFMGVDAAFVALAPAMGGAAT